VVCYFHVDEFSKFIGGHLHQSQMVQRLPHIRVNYLQPPLRNQIDQYDTFVLIGTIEVFEIEIKK
jgi:hypothetical protein